MIFIIGGRGRLGQALLAEYRGVRAKAVERGIYDDWWRPGSQDRISRYFSKRGSEASTIFVASGLLDPKLSQEEHLRVNYLLPKNVIKCTTGLGFKVITFGTVMEHLIENKNSYIKSKSILGDYVVEVVQGSHPVTHIRMHTLFGGGQPSSFMFLGHMLDAILRDIPFEMSSGNQLREYHHVYDEVKAIRAIADSGVTGVFELNHGHPIRLNDIAKTVFYSLGKKKLLRIGAIADPVEENYAQRFERPIMIKDIQFRDTLPAIVDYIKQYASQ